MATNALQVNLLDDLQNEVGAIDVAGEKIQLTPYLILACALLYMVAADGELGAEESSHLQAVLGGDEDVLRYGVHFVQTVSLDRFLIEAPELLSMKDKWCILANVCDALLSDGHADTAELAQFSRLKRAFGIQDKQFEPYFKILALKNDKSILGRYTGVREERQPMTPHLALASALLYMLTSDGSIGAQEVGHLEAVIGEFEGLQKVALTYVRTVKLKAFLDEASAVLRPEQKLYILLNVCDSMLADGEVAHIEDKLFLSMLSALGYNEASFARFHQVLETKNVKSFDASQFKNSVTHERVASNDDAEGEVFDNKLSDLKLAKVPNALRDGEKLGGPKMGAAELEMNQFIARQMQSNTQHLSSDFDGKANIAKVERNATEGLNLQPIDLSPEDPNRQKTVSSASAKNDQMIQVDSAAVHRQEVQVELLGTHKESIDSEIRGQNIQEAAVQVNKRLDRFEAANFSFLQIGRAQKFTDEFVLIEHNESSVNRQLIGESFTRTALATNGAGHDGVGTAAANVETKGEQSPVGMSNITSHLGSVFATQSSAGFQFHSANAILTSRHFVIPYKQIAVALVAIVFATPIYTRPSQSREAVGHLVLMQEQASELSEHRHVLGSEMAATSTVP